MMSSTSPSFSTQVLGQTEKALNAILGRELAGTGVDEQHWVALTLTVMRGASVTGDELAAQIDHALKIGPAAAQAMLGELASKGLVSDPVNGELPIAPTEAGAALHARIRIRVGEITERMWGDLPAEDLDTTGRVLSTILARANDELAAACETCRGTHIEMAA